MSLKGEYRLYWDELEYYIRLECHDFAENALGFNDVCRPYKLDEIHCACLCYMERYMERRKKKFLSKEDAHVEGDPIGLALGVTRLRRHQLRALLLQRMLLPYYHNLHKIVIQLAGMTGMPFDQKLEWSIKCIQNWPDLDLGFIDDTDDPDEEYNYTNSIIRFDEGYMTDFECFDEESE